MYRADEYKRLRRDALLSATKRERVSMSLRMASRNRGPYSRSLSCLYAEYLQRVQDDADAKKRHGRDDISLARFSHCQCLSVCSSTIDTI